MSEVRAAYRTLLRAVKARIDPSSTSSWAQEARRLFRSGNSAEPVQLQLARDYALLLHAVHDYKVQAQTPSAQSPLDTYSQCLIDITHFMQQLSAALDRCRTC